MSALLKTDTTTAQGITYFTCKATSAGTGVCNGLRILFLYRHKVWETPGGFEKLETTLDLEI